MYIKFVPIGETESVSFMNVDRAICRDVLHVPVDDIKWGGGVLDWVNKLILLFQMGASAQHFTECMNTLDIDTVEEDEKLLMKAFQYITSNYTLSTSTSYAHDIPLI